MTYKYIEAIKLIKEIENNADPLKHYDVAMILELQTKVISFLVEKCWELEEHQLKQAHGFNNKMA